MKPTKYAGIFEITFEGVDGIALAVDTDEIQFWADSIADAGFVGVPIDILHRMDVYDGPARSERLAQGDRWRDDVINYLKESAKNANDRPG